MPDPLDDRRSGLSGLAEVSKSPLPSSVKLALASKPHVLGLGDAVHLTLTSDVVLELGDQQGCP